MAESSKPKRPPRSKKAPEPDFSPFEDWLSDGPAGKWPYPLATDKELSAEQQRIVAANVQDLGDKEAWFEKVQAFEAALSALADEARQKNTRAEYCIRFDRHVFADGPKDFTNYPFPCSVSFGGAAFGDGDVWFSGATFGDGDVSFLGATFGDGDVSFSGAAFGDGDVTFFGAIFGEGSVRFEWAVFGDGDVSFDGATFGEGTVSFGGATFGDGDVSFSEAAFGDGNVWFSRATFGDGTVWFDRATFGDGTVFFSEAKFGEGSVRFEDVSFQSTNVSAPGMIFTGNLTVKSHFPEAVDFRRLDVKGTASFSGSSFAKVPDFRDAKFDRPPEVAGMVVPRPGHKKPKAWIVLCRIARRYRGIEHPGAEPEKPGRGSKNRSAGNAANSGASEPAKRQRSWPSRAASAVADAVRPFTTSIFYLAADRDDVAKFRKLKSMALAANDHEKDGEFFAGEMLAKRGFETTTFFGLLFNSIYWWLSDFGQSFVRPLIWLCASFLTFAASCLFLIRGALTLEDRLWFAADFSFRNMLPLFGSLFRFTVAPEGHVSWYQRTYNCLRDARVDIDRLVALGIFQNLIGTVLLFLLLLALRNKFRLK